MLGFNALSSNPISAIGRVFDAALNEIAVTTASAELAGVITSVTRAEPAVNSASTETVANIVAGATRAEPAVTTASTETAGVITSVTRAEPALVTSSSEIGTVLVNTVSLAETAVVTGSTESAGVITSVTRAEPALVTSSTETAGVITSVTRAEPAVVTGSTESAGVITSVTRAEPALVTSSSESAAAIDNLSATITSKVTVSALLDIDGNTEGSPGGLPAPGFSPPSSVVLAQHIESALAATYTITADFDPLLETEITTVFFNDNPANVLSYSIIGADLFITANTPADVYAQASTFMVNRKVVPQFNEFINYNVRFNTLVKRDNDGRNFYSNKFYAEQNSVCFLQDDGTGLIDLYEEVTPGTTKKLKTVGRLDYTTGFVEVKNLMITSLYDLELFFFVESLDSIIPTKDYFTEQNNLLVQSKTITFPTGEQVEISQYEKQTDIVDLEIYVTARSYSLADPLTTVETRTATYVLRIVPDYDLGKDAIKQLLLEQEA
jgi:hypothetical protein